MSLSISSRLCTLSLSLSPLPLQVYCNELWFASVLPSLLSHSPDFSQPGSQPIRGLIRLAGSQLTYQSSSFSQPVSQLGWQLSLSGGWLVSWSALLSRRINQTSHGQTIVESFIVRFRSHSQVDQVRQSANWVFKLILNMFIFYYWNWGIAAGEKNPERKL